MSRQYISSDVKCPRYKYETGGRTIHCEGFCEGGSVLNFIRHRGLFKMWKARYCKDKYERCYLYKAITDYEKENAGKENENV